MKYNAIAIDGPAGSGKSTVARILAKRLDFIYVDSGAMYRAIAWLISKKKFHLSNTSAVIDLAKNTLLRYEQEGIVVDDQYITDELRTSDISMLSSQIAKNAEIRKILVEKLQATSKQTHVVMDGRDIGTVVLPDADVKVFLTASIEERAQRRYQELVDKGIKADKNAILEDIRERDDRDQTRSSSPLQMATDAILIDTTHRSIEEIVDQIFAVYCTKMGGEA